MGNASNNPFKIEANKHHPVILQEMSIMANPPIPAIMTDSAVSHCIANTILEFNLKWQP